MLTALRLKLLHDLLKESIVIIQLVLYIILFPHSCLLLTINQNMKIVYCIFIYFQSISAQFSLSIVYTI